MMFRGKQTYRIDCVTSGRGDRVEMYYQGQLIGESATPLRTAAELLKDHASSFDAIEMWRGEKLCMTGLVGKLIVDNKKKVDH